ncbi:hypothetical protein [Klebsiella michiganensis]|uniref:hypothetical protein n=1 Tax=Klebsiella michiganensis TaxID=1134687 RepID=UPI0013A554A9|nr:hypothetical protein [Klebsiella michiganensis]
MMAVNETLDKAAPAVLDLSHLFDESFLENLADDVNLELVHDGSDLVATAIVLKEFTHQISQHPDAEPETWLVAQFRKHAELWESDTLLVKDAKEIISTVNRQRELAQSLTISLEKGKSRNNWLAKQLENSAKCHGVLSVRDYARGIDEALNEANKKMATAIFRTDGMINMNPNLDGFIAEVHHVNTFNVNAKAAGSSSRAELVINPGNVYNKNSVDIQIKDANGKVVRRYQSKYCADANATQTAFEKGDYRGQGSLVPENQSEGMTRKSVEVIEHDGIKSTPLSKEEAVKQRERAHQEKKATDIDWAVADSKTIGKELGKTALISAGLGVAFQAARISGRRIWNHLTGKENNSAQEDIREFVTSSVTTAGGALLTVAISGGLTVACKKGFLGQVMKNSPVGRLAMLGTVTVDNLKNIHDLAMGKISKEEALDRMGSTTVTTLAGIAGADTGVTLGATIGTIFGPVGTFVGGMVGGIACGMLGSTIGDKIYTASKSLVKSVASSIGNTASAVGQSVSNAFNSIISLFS